MRWRSPLAGLVIIAGLVLYVIAAVTLADFVPDHVLAETVYRPTLFCFFPYLTLLNGKE